MAAAMVTRGRGPQRLCGGARRALGAAVAVLAIAPAAHAAPPLVADYHLDENPVVGAVSDSSGNGLHGDVGGVLDHVTGRFVGAIDFTHLGRIDVPGSALLEPPGVSVVAWIRYKGLPDGPPGIGAGRAIVAKGGSGCRSSWALTTGPAAGSGATFSVWDGTPAGPTYSAPAGNTVWDGAWHALAGTYDGGAVRLYVDGVAVGVPVPAAPPRYDLPVRRMSIGAQPDAGCGPPEFTGMADQFVDEVQVYSRALSSAEVARLHAATGPAPPVLVPDPPAGGGAGGGGGGGGTPPTGGAGGSAPVPSFAPRPKGAFPGASSFDGRASTVASGTTVASYSWDFDSDGRFEVTCGPVTPLASHVFKRTGPHKVTLKVTDALGRSGQSTGLVDAALALAKAKREVSSCEQPLGGQQADTPGCIKTFSFGIVEVNGRGDATQCFTIEARAKDASVVGRFTRATDPARPLSSARYYTARIRGPVALNGLPVPLPANVGSEYDSGKASISLGRASILVTAPGGKQLRLPEIPLEKVISPKSSREYPRPGAFTLFSGAVEGKLAGWGGLKRGAGVEVLLVDHASIIKLSLKLPDAFSDAYGRTVEAWVAVRTTNAGGFQFEGAKIGPIDAVFLGPLVVKKLFFEYRRTNEIWNGGANFQLLGVSPVEIKASPPPPDYGFGLRQGAFDHAGGGVAFPYPPRPQLFPGIGLKEIGGAIGVKPLRFTGRMAIDVGGSFTVDGSAFVGLATPSEPYDFPEAYAPPGLEFLAGRRLDALSIAIGGKTQVDLPVIGPVDLVDGHVFYRYPDYAEVGGGFDYKPVDRLSVTGTVGGFAAVTRKLFNLEGEVNACADIEITKFCLNVGSVISTKGIAFCAVVPVPITPYGPVLPVQVSVGYRWGDKTPDFTLFSCDRGPYREQRPVRAAQAGAPVAFTVARGAPSAMVRVTGGGGVPAVVLTRPDGTTVTLPAPGAAAADPAVVAFPIPEQQALYIGLKSPAAGRWTVAPAAGSVPVAGVATAAAVAAPRFTARVTGRGTRRAVVYTRRADPGQQVTLLERGPTTFRVLGAATGASGRVAFTPGAGRGGAREIVAQIEQGGVVRETRTVARYVAPPAARPGRVRGLRVRRRGTTLVLRWRPVRGAAQYAVRVAVRGQPPILRLTRARTVVVAGVPRGRRGTVQVGALRADRVGGRQARAGVPRR